LINGGINFETFTKYQHNKRYIKNTKQTTVMKTSNTNIMNVFNFAWAINFAYSIKDVHSIFGENES